MIPVFVKQLFFTVIIDRANAPVHFVPQEEDGTIIVQLNNTFTKRRPAPGAVTRVDRHTDHFNGRHTTTRLNCVGRMLDTTSSIKQNEYAVRMANQAKRERWHEMSDEIRASVEKYRREAAVRRGDQRFLDKHRLDTLQKY